MDGTTGRKFQVAFFVGSGLYLVSLFFPWWTFHEEDTHISTIGLRPTLGGSRWPGSISRWL